MNEGGAMFQQIAMMQVSLKGRHHDIVLRCPQDDLPTLVRILGYSGHGQFSVQPDAQAASQLRQQTQNF
jgi:hypothetical protein